jgi:hypothetical protein
MPLNFEGDYLEWNRVRLHWSHLLHPRASVAAISAPVDSHAGARAAAEIRAVQDFIADISRSQLRARAWPRVCIPAVVCADVDRTGPGCQSRVATLVQRSLFQSRPGVQVDNEHRQIQRSSRMEAQRPHQIRTVDICRRDEDKETHETGHVDEIQNETTRDVLRLECHSFRCKLTAAV